MGARALTPPARLYTFPVMLDPQDIRKHEFTRAWRGYDREEVHAIVLPEHQHHVPGARGPPLKPRFLRNRRHLAACAAHDREARLRLCTSEQLQGVVMPARVRERRARNAREDRLQSVPEVVIGRGIEVLHQGAAPLEDVGQSADMMTGNDRAMRAGRAIRVMRHQDDAPLSRVAKDGLRPEEEIGRALGPRF